VRNNCKHHASFSKAPVFTDEKHSNTMETKTLEMPVIQKNKIEQKNKDAAAVASACCAPKNNASVCCTPSETPEENGGACCAQPADGSSCCDK
jgi:hypothetical protein